MADYAEGLRSEPPRELNVAFDFRRWGLMPDAGGLLDQAPRLIEKMTVAEEVYNVMRNIKDATNLAEYTTKNPGAWTVFVNVQKLRKLRQ